MNKVLPTIAIISDTAYYPIFLRQYLGELYHIYPCQSSNFVINNILGVGIDVLIIDDRSFNHEIFSLCREFRKRVEFHNLPILIITSKLRTAYIDRLIKAGANDFIREPLEKEDVLTKLKDVEKYRQVQGKLVGIKESLSHEKSPLTSLKTRFLLNRAPMERILKTLASGGPLCMVVMSIDQTNTLSNPLQERIDSFLKSQLRPNDLFYSLGQLKYLVMLDQTTIREGFLLAEQLKNALSLNEFTDEDGRVIKLTLSIGIAGQKRPPYATINEMIKDAKKALLRAREVGNQIILHHNESR